MLAMAHGAHPQRLLQPSPELRQRLQRQLQCELGAHAELVSIRPDGDRRLRGLVICSGRVLSFMLDAEEQRLRTQPLFELLRLSSAPAVPS